MRVAGPWEGECGTAWPHLLRGGECCEIFSCVQCCVITDHNNPGHSLVMLDWQTNSTFVIFMGLRLQMNDAYWQFCSIISLSKSEIPQPNSENFFWHGNWNKSQIAVVWIKHTSLSISSVLSILWWCWFEINRKLTNQSSLHGMSLHWSHFPS